MTEVPGLYFLGLTWQHTRGSALIGWVQDDAEFIAAEIDAFQEERAFEPDALKSPDVRTAQSAAAEGSAR